ncbi:MAG: CRISPR-associated endonuclease Cas2 [Rhodopila sp.]
MSERIMLMVYCYDVASNKARARVAHLLEDRAVRVQDSVFEMRLTQVAADRLFRDIARLLDEGDMLRMYAIGAAGLPRCQSYGGSPISGDVDSWII